MQLKKEYKMLKYLIILMLVLQLMPVLHTNAMNFPASYLDSTTTIQTKSWVPEDKTVYGEGKGQDLGKEDDDGDPGMLEGLLITLINSIGNFFDWLFGLVGLTLQNVVYGRVNGGGVNFNGNRVSLFTFELSKGNPYGIVAAQIYSIIRGIIYVLIACAIMLQFVTVLFIGNSSKALTKLKEQFSSMVIGFALLTIMPSIIDLMLYVRDIMIYAIGVKGMEALDIATPNLATFFKDNNDKSIMAALMYTGSFALTLYFAFQYIGIALSMVIDLFAFPFVVLNYQFNRKALGTWFKSVLSNAIVPIADCCLLMIPAVFGLLGKDNFAVNVIQLMVCSMLIPARREIRTVLGVASNNALELSGLMAMRGAGMVLGAAVAGTVGAAAGLHHSMSDAKSDESMASYYDDLARNEKVQGGMMGGSNAGINAMSLGTESASGSSPTMSASGATVSGVSGQPPYSGDLFGTDIGSGNIGSAHGMDLSNTADRHANVHNFEDNAFSNMSNARKAELYRQRADLKRKQGVAEAGAKFAGTVAGMGAGLATTTFMSPATKGIAMGALGSMGRDLGAGAVGMAASRVGTDSPFVESGGNGGGQAVVGQSDGVESTSLNNVETQQMSEQSSVMPMGNQAMQMQEPSLYMEEQSLYQESEDIGMEYALNDQQVAVDYGNEYLKMNADEISDCSRKAMDMQNNTVLKAKLDDYYSKVSSNQKLVTQDEKYKEFRGYAAAEMGKGFEGSMMNNSNLKSGGNKQLDKNASMYLSNGLKSKLQREDCKQLSKANLDLYGYHFN